MDDAALMGCIAWIAHGFEVVQSVFANWKFTAADSVAVNAMHGALLIGPRHNIGSRAAEWLRALPEFEVELFLRWNVDGPRARFERARRPAVGRPARDQSA